MVNSDSDSRRVSASDDIEVGAYLPPFENVTVYHMKDLLSGTKKVCYL